VHSSCNIGVSRQQTVEIQKMFFAHVTQLLINTLRGQVVVGGCQGKPFSTGAAGESLRVAQQRSSNTLAAARVLT